MGENCTVNRSDHDVGENSTVNRSDHDTGESSAVNRSSLTSAFRHCCGGPISIVVVAWLFCHYVVIHCLSGSVGQCCLLDSCQQDFVFHVNSWWISLICCGCEIMYVLVSIMEGRSEFLCCVVVTCCVCGQS